MEQYCQYPPYVFQHTLPSVMILLSNAQTMSGFAYTNNVGWSQDTAGGGFNPATNYYGYFDVGAYYSAGGSGGFLSLGKKSTFVSKPANSWDGNFLNWLTMRRIDVMKKVLTGGTGDAYESCGKDNTAYKKWVDDGGLYTPYNAGTKTMYARFSHKTACTGNAPSSIEKIYDPTGNSGLEKVYATNLQVSIQNFVQPEGLIQRNITRARIGLTFFDQTNGEGGQVVVPITANFGPADYNKIKTPSQFNGQGDEPLAEALWTVTGYLAQVNNTASIITALGACPTGATCGPVYGSTYPIGQGTAVDPFVQHGNRSRCTKGAVVVITDGEPCNDGNLPSLLSNYADNNSRFNCSGSSCNSVSSLGIAATSIPACTSTLPSPISAGVGGAVAGLEDVALWAHDRDLRPDVTGNQNLDIFIVKAFGIASSNLLKFAAVNGSVDNVNAIATTADFQAAVAASYVEPATGYELEEALDRLFSNLVKRATSGTAASVLASGEGSGANLVQAVFYPRRLVGEDIIQWTGTMQNLWYFVDPFFGNASIREDTDGNNVLNLVTDKTAEYFFDQDKQTTFVDLFSNSATGTKTTTFNRVKFDLISPIWESGALLQATTPASRPRIFTSIDNSASRSLLDFTTSQASELRPFLNAAADNDAEAIIDYVRGVDTYNSIDNSWTYRQRTVTVSGTTGTWKLGDVINSTPKIISRVPLNKYDQPQFYNDMTYRAYTQSAGYRNRGMVFAGSNDGMLHAFKLGKLEFSWTTPTQGTYDKARLQNVGTGELGDERWAFIPRNALPYLKYMMQDNYCHLYYVDLAPQVFDASIDGDTDAPRTDNSWRTILVGGMRFGGACRDATATCTDCVKTPIPGEGYSSYFALDVTNPESPSLLWEFSHPELGFATTGPSILRMNEHNPPSGSVNDRSLNGRWYVVFGSGPTGPITDRQFMGRSDQNLSLFVLDLKTGNLLRKISTKSDGSVIADAFAGSMVNASADFNLDYEDEALYFGYTRKDSGTGTWTQGGVARLQTNNSRNPANWTLTTVIDGIGPVTASIARLQNNTFHNSWLYFGTGRYFYETATSSDDADSARGLFGVKEPCMNAGNTINLNCTTSVSAADLTLVGDNTVISDSVANGTGFAGWRIALDTVTPVAYDNGAAVAYRAERVITDPLATSSGSVFFTTYRPYGADCSLGGKSFIWAARYNTGGFVGTANLKGKALVQVSTASVEQLDLAKTFGETPAARASILHRGGRRSVSMEGVPPTAQGLSLISPPPPVNRVLHMKER